MPRILEEARQGRVRLVIRNYPLDRHALLGAATVSCLPQEDRIAAHERLVAPDRLPAEPWRAVFPEAEMPSEDRITELRLCADRRDVQQRIFGLSRRTGEEVRTSVVPTFVVGRTVVAGAVGAPVLLRMAAAS